VASIRRYARRALILLTALFLMAVVVQILTAGFGIFGATSLDLHEDLGFTLTHGLSILIFLAALVAWIGGTDLALAFLIGALTTVQVFLPELDNRWIAGLHPVNALLLFLLALVLLWRVRPVPSTGPVSRTP
jgi:predicted outer membrane lipoprotein